MRYFDVDREMSWYTDRGIYENPASRMNATKNPVILTDRNGNEKKFTTIRMAAIALNCSTANIRNVINGSQPSAKGYSVRYAKNNSTPWEGGEI